MGSETESRVRERAYQLWEESGRPDGMEHEHWAQAEREAAASARPAEASQVRKAPAADEAARKRPAKSKGGKS